MTGRQKLSEIQRYLKNRFDYLQDLLKFEAKRPISDTQLRRLLRVVDWETYNKITEPFFGIQLELEDEEWISVDGKELRGSLERDENGHKEKRGEVIINAIRQKDKRAVAQSYYRGDKESEKVEVRNLLINNDLSSNSITLDALHCNPKTTTLINQNGGRYIIQLKADQEELNEEMMKYVEWNKAVFEVDEKEKSHGRFNQRNYTFFDLKNEDLDKRWHQSNIVGLVKVHRHTLQLKRGKEESETSLYLTNRVWNNQQQAKEFAEAIRGHWLVESDNYVRDVTLGEDSIKTPKGNTSRLLATIRTWALQLLRMTHCNNLRAQIERFSDCPEDLTKFLISTNLAP